MLKLVPVLVVLIHLNCITTKNFPKCVNPSIDSSNEMLVKFDQIYPSDKSIYLSGTIFDKLSNDPIPGVNLYTASSKVLNVKSGTSTDINGNFTLLSEKTFSSDSLFISLIGYQELKFIISDIIDLKNK